MLDPDTILSTYGLAPHPEGGWFREFHCSSRRLGDLPGYPGPRPALTAIYFCLKAGEFSAFHRLRSEEVWLHLAGGPLELILLDAGRESRRRVASAAGGGPPAAVVPAGAIQAARPTGSFAFVACLVAPGFDFADFELLPREALLAGYPDSADLVRTLTR
jgi:predicted cupin superfamily sugar epimerase